jgi:hypothetical protein
MIVEATRRSFGTIDPVSFVGPLGLSESGLDRDLMSELGPMSLESS